MIIVTDCLTEQPAEGCLKIANSLIKRIKERSPSTTIISYRKKSPLSDKHMQLNKLFLNQSLLLYLRESKEQVLYIPNASCTLACAARIWVMSRIAKVHVKALFVQWHSMKWLTGFLLRNAKTHVICLSGESTSKYHAKGIRASHLRTGIDIHKFIPVSDEYKLKLRGKYHIPENKKVVLHVGHLKKGRNLDKLCLIDDRFHVVVVISSITATDHNLRNLLKTRNNISIIETYIESIEELYQLSDVYFFPVVEPENCIDIPLSVLEAAACDIPVLSTRYGALKEFDDAPGICFLNDLDEKGINSALDKLIFQRSVCANRDIVKPYDWNNAVEQLLEEEMNEDTKKSTNCCK